MDEAPVGITVAEPGDDDNPLIYANDGFVELTGYPREEALGRDCPLVVSARDVTERRKRERKIRKRNEMLEDLAGFFSHDLRTPLSTARGRLELAVETGETDHAGKASEALERLDKMLTDAVNVFRTGDIVGDTDEVDIEEVVDDVATVEHPETASVEVPEPPRVEADEDAIRRLFENLVSNSVEHGDGKEAHIHIGRLDDGFYYEDDGPGIPEDEREKVFKMGYSKKEGEGTGMGMGMASVRQIVLVHDWRIRLEDAEELGGARFEVRT